MDAPQTRPGPLFALAGFVGLVVGGGLLIGGLTSPGAWYAGLERPSFDPPGWVFGPVWTVLYVLIAIAGWRVWRSPPASRAMKLWWAQLGLNFLWSPTFFAAHQIGAALVVVALMLASILAFIAASWRLDRPASLMFVPYACWVAFATLLNGAILVLN
jgi:tryptophan-rich sensory protein